MQRNLIFLQPETVGLPHYRRRPGPESTTGPPILCSIITTRSILEGARHAVCLVARQYEIDLPPGQPAHNHGRLPADLRKTPTGLRARSAFWAERLGPSINVTRSSPAFNHSPPKVSFEDEDHEPNDTQGPDEPCQCRAARLCTFS